MVETKCAHVDHAQAAAAKNNSDPNNKLAPDNWQALIALLLKLLRKHHEVNLERSLERQLLAASPFRRLLAKYTMPAYRLQRMVQRRGSPGSMHPSSSHRQRHVPVHMEETVLEAFPDTGSELNIISLSLLSQLNLGFQPAQALTIQTPRAREIQILGTTELEVAFQGEAIKHKRTFHVLSKCAHGIILGKSFLEATETLTRFKHRIKSRLIHLVNSIPRLHLLGSVTERVIGSINGKPTIAVHDTGSDVTVISWKEAERLGLKINTDHAHRTFLKFVDGEQVYTDGAVLNADWRFGTNLNINGTKVSLQVLRDLTCDLILSNDILFGCNAYGNPAFFPSRGRNTDDAQ